MAISCGQEWLATDALFEKGIIEETYFSKLFHPGDVVVGIVDTQLMGYLIKTCTFEPDSTSLELKAMSWTFNEVFRKKEHNLKVD
jgi:hypothetical protein